MQEILLEVHWLGLHALSAEGLGLISDWGTEIPHATWQDQKIKLKNKCILEQGQKFHHLGICGL